MKTNFLKKELNNNLDDCTTQTAILLLIINNYSQESVILSELKLNSSLLFKEKIQYHPTSNAGPKT